MSQMMLETLAAPKLVQEALGKDRALYEEVGARLRRLNPSVVATIARGSSDNAACYAEYLIPLCTGRVVASVPPSVVTLLNSRLHLKEQFALAISQGGGSPDIISTLSAARTSGALAAALVNNTASPLADAAEVVLPQNAGPELSITATKSVLCTFVVLARLVAEWANDVAFKDAIAQLPLTLESAAKIGSTLDEQALKGTSHVYVLSRGLGQSAAREVALKLKETCGLHAEPFSAAEVRHGPREIVDQGFLVIALAMSGSDREDVLPAAAELRSQGARVLTVGPVNRGCDFSLPPIDDYRVAPIVALQLLYPWLARCSKALGRDPDHPRTLKEKVIKTV